MRIAVLVLLFACDAPGGPSEDLAAAIDLETARERRRAAHALAKRTDVTLEQWLAAARTFGEFEPVPKGVFRSRVPLRVGRKVEATEITVYVPPGYRPDRPAPLLLTFHSTGGNGRGMYANWRRAADKLGSIVVAPSEAGPNDGYAFSERERLAALATMRWARRRYNVDENRVFVTGFGRGAHLAWDLALRQRDRFAALISVTGAPGMVMGQGRNNLRYLDNVIDLPLRGARAAGHPRIMMRLLDVVFARLAERRALDARLIDLRPGEPAPDWGAFLAQAKRNPWPERCVRAYARRGEGRAFFAEVLAARGNVKEEFRLVASPEEARDFDQKAYLLLMQKRADERTARLEVRRTEPRRFTATGDRIRSFRLLLADGGDFEVTFNGTRFRRSARASARVLLTEFVERFDRTFLPVAEVRVP